MVAGGLMAIFFICTLVCWAVWSMIYVFYASHYFLTTLTDSSSGQAEVYYPREGFTDWWWKPILCGWVLLVWLIPATLLLSPLLALSPLAFLIVWSLVLWFAFPMSLASVLYGQNWLVPLHRGVIGRMLHHGGAFVYVHLMTFAMCAGSLYMVVRGMTDFVWLIPAIVLVPAVQLLYARHWGRFAWLSLNFLPRQAKKGRSSLAEKKRALRSFDEAEESTQEAIPEMPAEEVEAMAADAFREGLPPNPAGAIKAAPAPHPPVEEYDEWTDMKPYAVLDDGETPFYETAAPPPAVTAPPTAPAIVEEEDEWATDKKPYALTEPGPEATPACAQETKSDADKPLEVSKYYDDRAKKEAEENRRREEEKRTMPTRSKKTPTFRTAFLGGVWLFMFYPSTMMAWATLAVFTTVEFLLMYMMLMVAPRII
jgi:hypothetical protein